MFKNLLITTAVLLVFGFTASAQTSAPKYERHNKWMVGGEVSYNTNNHYDTASICFRLPYSRLC